MLILRNVTGPVELRPTDSSNSGMRISRLASIDISWVIEQVPFLSANTETFAGLGVEFGELHPGVGDEDRPKTLFNIL